MLKTQWLNITFFFLLLLTSTMLCQIPFACPLMTALLDRTDCWSLSIIKSPSQLKTPISYPVKISSLSRSTGWTMAPGTSSRDGTQSASQLLHLSLLQTWLCGFGQWGGIRWNLSGWFSLLLGLTQTRSQHLQYDRMQMWLLIDFSGWLCRVYTVPGDGRTGPCSTSPTPT